MTPEELANVLAGVPEHELLEAFTTALSRRTDAAPESPPIAPDELVALDLATPQTPTPEADEDEALYQKLFGPPAIIPLSDEDRATYEALYGPGTGGDAA